MPPKVVLTTNADLASPIRTCVGCRRRRARSDLTRCVISDDGHARIGPTASGRGAWLCGQECLDAALTKRRLDRAWRTTAPTTVAEDLRQAFAALEMTGRTTGQVTGVRSGPAPHERLTTRVKG